MHYYTISSKKQRKMTHPAIIVNPPNGVNGPKNLNLTLNEHPTPTDPKYVDPPLAIENKRIDCARKYRSTGSDCRARKSVYRETWVHGYHHQRQAVEYLQNIALK
jgi:hypothetical protein